MRKHGGSYPCKDIFIESMFDVGLFVATRHCISKEKAHRKTESCVQKAVGKLYEYETPNE